MAEKMWSTWGNRHEMNPQQIIQPRSLQEVQDALTAARAQGKRLKVVGSSRSSSAIAQPVETLLSLDYLTGATAIDPQEKTATFLAGTTVAQANKILVTYGLAFENLGRLGAQTLAGAVSTGTHGTGLGYGIIPTQVLALDLVTSTGELITCSPSQNPEIFRAALVGLGALGIIVRLTFRVVPLFRLHAAERRRPYTEIIPSFAERSRGADHYELAWYPGERNVKTRRLTRLPLLTEGFMPPAAVASQARRHGRDYALNNGLFEASSYLGSKVPAVQGALNKVSNFAKANRRYADLAPAVFLMHRTVRQNNMEYAFDLAYFQKVMVAIKEATAKADIHPSFPLVIRTAAADSLPLSQAYGRETVFISVREYWRNDHRRYFDLLEKVFIEHGGRPHWGQLHSLTATDLAQLYPEFADFVDLREEMDPEGTFLNPYLEKVLLVPQAKASEGQDGAVKLPWTK